MTYMFLWLNWTFRKHWVDSRNLKNTVGGDVKNLQVPGEKSTEL